MMSDADAGEAGEGDQDRRIPRQQRMFAPPGLMRTRSSRAGSSTPGSRVSHRRPELRTSKGLSQLLVDVLSPAAQIASRHNPMLDRLGFPSGSELTVISLPLRLYAAFGVLGSVRSLRRSSWSRSKLFSFRWDRVVDPNHPALGVPGTSGRCCDGGHAGLHARRQQPCEFRVLLRMELWVRERHCLCCDRLRPPAALDAGGIAMSVLVTVHFVIAVLVGVVVLPLVVLDLNAQRSKYDLCRLLSPWSIGGMYLWFGRGDVQFPSGTTGH